MIVPIKTKCTWILKAILNQRKVVCHIDDWKDMLLQEKFSARNMYYAIKTQHQTVGWRKVFYGNTTRPWDLCTIWLACHNRLATKDRLCNFGVLNEDCCYFAGIEK